MKINFNLIIVVSLMLVAVMILPLIAMANPPAPGGGTLPVGGGSTPPVGGGSSGSGSGALNQLVGKIVGILNSLITLLFALATVYFFWGIVQLIAGAGEPKAIETGKLHILWGIIGMTIMLSAWGISRMVQNFLGVY